MTLQDLQQTWQSNKVRVLLVGIPILLMVLAAMALKDYREDLLKAAKKLLAGTQAKDATLAQDEESAKQQAAQAQQQAAQLGQQAQQVEQGAGDPDWNKKL